MGNYKDLELEFIERTLSLISQYEGLLYKFQFKEQYNHTLLINCLLGLIVMPKERILSLVPKHKLTATFRKEIGLAHSLVNPSISELKDLIISLRHSIAHFSIEVLSHDEERLIDEIVFYDSKNENRYEIIRFRASELLPFIRYYASWVMSNYKKRELE